jgi:PKD repeat protein
VQRYNYKDLIYVDPGPQADFSLSQNQGCDSMLVNFNDQTVSDSTIISYEWSFGNGNTGSTDSTSQMFTSGQYNIELIVTSSAGCPDTMIKQINVYPHPDVIASSDTFICLGESIPLNVTGALTYTWAPPGSIDSVNSPNIIATPDRNTNYVVIGTDSNNCSATDTVRITVNPIPNGNVTEDKNICIGQSVEPCTIYGLLMTQL